MKNIFHAGKDIFLRIKKKYPLQTEIALYASVSLLAKIVDMVVLALTRLGCEPQLYKSFVDLLLLPGSEFANMLGTALGFIVGTIVEYIVSSFVVFERNKRGQTPMGFVVFIVISVGGLGIHLLGQWVGGQWGFNPYIIKLVMGFFAMAYNYIVKKIVLYTKEKWVKPVPPPSVNPDSDPTLQHEPLDKQ